MLRYKKGRFQQRWIVSAFPLLCLVIVARANVVLELSLPAPVVGFQHDCNGGVDGRGPVHWLFGILPPAVLEGREHPRIVQDTDILLFPAFGILHVTESLASQ